MVAWAVVQVVDGYVLLLFILDDDVVVVGVEGIC
jgi:hypothetical protein